ncbi:hypothetical protein A7978_02610 [Borrelia turicatae]|uniref:Uncharacterized protein n=1 Tax=Borrelia turicatae TaxID=142 RepID=A0A172XBQ7_BORTU|nr:hypothetical protein [Borrelia turicatae]ANF33988.1 hypothetical protein A7978_02610 [Borrelia turicatae]UPA14844.1 hypothetical protein btBTE5EL_000521 [Borrelia turicatae]
MNKYCGLSFFYLLIGILFLFLIVFIQFRDLSLNVFLLKDLKLLVNNKVEDSQYVLDSLILSIRGIKINLSKTKPIIIPANGLHLYPISYKVQDNAIHVYFENNIFLLFSFDSNDNFNVSSNLSKKLLISYEIESDYKVLFDENIIIKGTDGHFEVALGKHSQMNEREISVSPQEVFQIGNLVEESQTSDELISREPSRDIPLDINSPVVYSLIKKVDKSFFDSALLEFRNKAYDAWSHKSNFSVEKGGWRRGNVYSFDEDIFIYLLAESLRRPNYEATFLNLKSLIDLNEDHLTYLSASYYVNAERLGKFFRYLSVNKTFINSLESDKLLRYLKEDAYLLEKIFLSENISILNGALDILRKPEVILASGFSLTQAYNVLSNYIIFLQFDNDSFVLGRLREELTKFVSTLFSVTSHGEAYVSDNKDDLSWDFEYTLKIAGLLKRLAFQLGDDLILEFAFNAIYYSLLKPDIEKIPYENYYADIVDNDYIPKFSLFPNLGIGHWIYGASKIVNFNFSNAFYSIDFNRNLNSPGYFFFKGISNPTLVKFRNINWFTDPRFYIYSDGWRYYSDNKILVLKITPKKPDDMKILLRFDDIKVLKDIDE